MESLKLLFKSFYDISLSQKFVIKGKKLGIGAFVWVAFIATVCLSASFYEKVSSTSFDLFRPLVSDLPVLTITDGQAVGNVIVSKDIMGKNDDIFFVVNTSSEQADFKDLPSKGIYVAKGGIFVKNGSQIRSFDFKEILPKGTTVIDEDFYENTFNIIKSVILKVFLPLFFIFFFLGYFWGALNLLLVFSFFSYVFSRFMHRTPTLEQRVRIVVLSMLPAMVLRILAGCFGLFFPFALYALICLVYMFTYFKRMDKDQAQPVADVA